ncbi:MAG: hypothetical protein AB2792_23030 [Candidatus Thiodiazotropha sp.]
MSDDNLETRVRKFNCMELPGQPLGMHMGTSYLVNDLWREVQKLKEESPSDPAGYDDLVKKLQQRVVALTIELSRHKEAIHNYMSMGHAGEQDEVVQIFMDEYLPDEPEDEVLSS